MRLLPQLLHINYYHRFVTTIVTDTNAVLLALLADEYKTSTFYVPKFG